MKYFVVLLIICLVFSCKNEEKKELKEFIFLENKIEEIIFNWDNDLLIYFEEVYFKNIK